MCGHFNRSCVVGAVAMAAFGSTLLCSNNSNGYRASVTVQVPLQFLLQDSPSLTWPLLHDFFPQYLPSSHLSGMLAPYSYRDGPVPSSNISKEASADVCDGSKSCGCLGRDTIANAVAKVGPAVVYISAPQDVHGIYVGTRICSGTIINEDGTILTCAHMFDPQRWPSLGKVKVILQDGRRFEGKVLDADLHSDIAIVKINSEIPLPVAKLGSSSGIRPGDWIISMGSHLTLRNSVTAGIVSCADRKSSDLHLSGMPIQYIQTNCAFSAGGSGGPLVNMDGEVVGVAIMAARGASGFGFAVPIDIVHKIIEHFKKSGVSPISWSDISKEASGTSCDGSKPHSCLGRDAIANVAAKTGPAVVSIAAPLDFFGIPTGTSRGTGTIINKDGTILTCARVVDFQSKIGSCKGKVEVTLQDGRKFKGKVLNTDRHSDIAVVKINSETPLPEAKIGSSSGLNPGDWVVAMGCPLTLKNTVTAGIVSCINRTSSELGFSGMSREYIQTDCTCHVGYSGGPLVNMDGEIVGLGIMKMEYADEVADGWSFSLPIDFVCKIIENFKKNRYVFGFIHAILLHMLGKRGAVCCRILLACHLCCVSHSEIYYILGRKLNNSII
ncbi:hypothetical protein VNO77_18355 [Canavalia gladiata]|uniref:Protease Do-like 14 n=1 Tax=Canavalia gladiata TaxID=3824 RepID=A0AAN9LPA5_CANGL